MVDGIRCGGASGRFGLAAARRTQILDAAAECARRSGFHGASMAEISKAAGMSSGHIYHFFANKEAIIAALVERDLEHVLSTFEKIEQSDGDVLDAMIREAESGFDCHMNRDEAALGMEISAEAARNPLVAAIVQSSDEIARAKIRGLLSCLAGGPQPHHHALIEVMAALFEGLSIRAIRNPDADRDGVKEQLCRTLRAVLEMAKPEDAIRESA